jgi:AcrR family transcriptional regulator
VNAVFTSRARHQGKSARTRARLMDAAVGVFARQGIEAASVSEIAQAADVANGTFYNHFRDKDEIVGAVAFAIAGDIARRLDRAMQGLQNAAERTSFATRQFIELATSTPDWGRALVRAVWSLPELRQQVSDFARADIERGVREGVFKVEVEDLLVDLFASMVITTVFLRLEGEAGSDAGAAVAEHQLRMLGMPPARAKRVARRKLVPLSLAEPLGPDPVSPARAGGASTRARN